MRPERFRKRNLDQVSAVTMNPARIMIVEDEMLVAYELEAILEDLGYEVVGIAPDLDTAMALAQLRPDLALVDLNLRDGLTGPEIGRLFCERGDTSVLFVTANPRILGDGISGAIGVLTKPADPESVRASVAYALRVRHGDLDAVPPPVLKVFAQG